MGVAPAQFCDSFVDLAQQAAGVEQMWLNDNPARHSGKGILQRLLKRGLSHRQETRREISAVSPVPPAFSQPQDFSSNKRVPAPSGNKEELSGAERRSTVVQSLVEPGIGNLQEF